MKYYSSVNPGRNTLAIPFFDYGVPAGFPSPADDYHELELDLNKYLIRHPQATFYVRVKGDSMQGASINDGDLLIVDRAEKAQNGDIVLGVIYGEFTVKRLIWQGPELFLHPENPKYKPTRITEEMAFEVWGKVIHVIHSTG